MRRHFLLQPLLQLLRLLHHLQWIHVGLRFRCQVRVSVHLLDLRFLDREDLEQRLDGGIGHRFAGGDRLRARAVAGVRRAPCGAPPAAPAHGASATATLTGILLPADLLGDALRATRRASSHCCFGTVWLGRNVNVIFAGVTSTAIRLRDDGVVEEHLRRFHLRRGRRPSDRAAAAGCRRVRAGATRCKAVRWALHGCGRCARCGRRGGARSPDADGAPAIAPRLAHLDRSHRTRTACTTRTRRTCRTCRTESSSASGTSLRRCISRSSAISRL